MQAGADPRAPILPVAASSTPAPCGLTGSTPWIRRNAGATTPGIWPSPPAASRAWAACGATGHFTPW